MRYLLSVVGSAALASINPGAAQAEVANIPSHPPEVAFVDEGPLGSVFRQTEGSLRLYTSDSDPAGASKCNDGCSSAWPPLYAPADAAPVGDWSVVTRSDRRQQWAYRGKPVYTRFHDSPDTPTGEAVPGWHLIAHTRTPATP